MLITPFDLAKEPLEINQTLPAGAMDYTPDVLQSGPLTVTGQADLLVEHHGHKEVVEDIRLRAHYDGDFTLLCARCLDPVPQHLAGDFDLIFRPEAADSDSGERSISEEETEIGYYEERGLVLEDVVREQVLLSLPSRTLCESVCKGLCQHCGINLNTATCDCGKAPADPRWSALAGLAGKLGS
jgi:uncharacterized protein